MRQSPSTLPSPSATDALLHMAQGALRTRAYPQAVELIKQALAMAPRHLPSHVMLVRATRLQGQTQQALAMCQQISQWAPQQVPVLIEQAQSLRQADQLDAARSAYEEALSIEPNNPIVHHNLANILQRQKQWPQAEHHYRQAIAQAPMMAEAYVELGNLLLTQGQATAGQLCYAQALNVRPDFMPAWQKLQASLGSGDIVQSVLNLHEQAHGQSGSTQIFLAMAQAALKLEPDNILAHFNLGIALKLAGEMRQALAPLEKVMALPPDNPLYRQSLYFHTLCLMYLGEHKRSVEGAQKLLAVAASATEQSKAQQLLAGLALDEGLIHKALTMYEQAIALDPDSSHAKMSYCAAHLYAEGEQGLRQPMLARELVAPLYAGPASKTWANTPEPDRRLKVAYLSGDFRQHSCAYFLAPLLTHLDRSQVELFAYTTNAMEDAFTLRFKELIGNWRRAAHLSDDELVAQMQVDGIDILVDLSGLTDGNRLSVVARKPAPVVLNWLGCLGSTGLDAVDWRVTDAWVDPAEHEWPGSEPAWRLEGCYLAYEPPAAAPEVSEPPMLKKGYPTFGSFNSLAKLSDSCVALWCKVLQAVPDARLLIKSRALKDADICAALLERIAQHGIASERITLHGWQAQTASHLDIYGEVDVALDSSPFNGVTTTCEASWMGVPVVSLIGQTPASRQGLSLLNAMGRPQWACGSREAFVATCVELVADRAQLAQERRDARARISQSMLMDGPGYAQRMMAVYRDAWRQYCAMHQPTQPALTS